MILIAEKTNGKIIGADKEFLQKYSIEELDNKFSHKINNLDELKKEEGYKDYDIESIPVKDYNIIFFVKENNSIIPNIGNELDSSNKDLSLNLDSLIPNETDNNSQPDSNNSDNSLNLDNLLNETSSPDNNNTTSNNDLSLNLDNLVPDETDNNSQPDSNNSDNSLNLDHLLNETSSPDNNNTTSSNNDSTDLDNLLNETLSITNDNKEKKNNFTNNATQKENTQNIENKNTKDYQNKKVIFNINFDIEAIKKKKKGKS
jgi:hypothetical protein